MDQCNFVDFLACTEAQILLVAQEWFTRGFSFAQVLYISLAGLELVVSGYGALRKQGPMEEVLKQVVAKVLFLGLVLLLLQLADTWLGTSLLEFPVTTASGVASDVTGGVQIAEPTLVIVVVKMGLTLFWGLFEASQPDTVFGMVVNPVSLLTSIPLILIALVVAGTFIRLAAQLLAAIIECYVAVGAGAVMIGFLAFRGTAPLGEGYLRYIVYATVKLFFILILVFFVIQLGDHAIAILADVQATGGGITTGTVSGIKQAANSRLTVALSLGAVAMLILGLMKLPSKLAQQMTATLSINIKGVLEKL